MPGPKSKKAAGGKGTMSTFLEQIQQSTLKAMNGVEQGIKDNLTPNKIMGDALIEALYPVIGKSVRDWEFQFIRGDNGYQVSVNQRQADGSLKELFKSEDSKLSPEKFLASLKNFKPDGNEPEIVNQALNQVMGVCNNLFEYKTGKKLDLADKKKQLILLGVALAVLIIAVAILIVLAPTIVGGMGIAIAGIGIGASFISSLLVGSLGTIGVLGIIAAGVLCSKGADLQAEFTKLSKLSPESFIGSAKECVQNAMDSAIGAQEKGWGDKVQASSISAAEIRECADLMDKISKISEKDLEGFNKLMEKVPVDKVDKMEAVGDFALKILEQPLTGELANNNDFVEAFNALIAKKGEPESKVADFLKINPELLAKVMNSQEKSAQRG